MNKIEFKFGDKIISASVFEIKKDIPDFLEEGTIAFLYNGFYYVTEEGNSIEDSFFDDRGALNYFKPLNVEDQNDHYSCILKNRFKRSLERIVKLNPYYFEENIKKIEEVKAALGSNLSLSPFHNNYQVINDVFKDQGSTSVMIIGEIFNKD